MEDESGQSIIIDSALTLEQALSQRQELPTPQEVLDRQRLIDVEYYSFDKKFHRGQIVIDQDLVEDVRGAFDLIRQTQFPVHSVIPIGDLRFLSDDEKSANANNSSGFCYRTIAGRDRLSNHAFGRAIDINPYLNPYIRSDYHQPKGVEYDPNVLGAITVDGQLVQYFKSKRWEWGGDWMDRKDYMHFEKPDIIEDK